MPNGQFDRRRFLIGTTFASATGAVTGTTISVHDGERGGPVQTFRGAVPTQEGAADVPPGVEGEGYIFLTPAEQAFVQAAVARLIPNDVVGPGAIEAGVPFFLDRQLAGPYGNGAHFYLGGPWPKGTPEQGYQSRFTPAQFYRAAIAAIDRTVSSTSSGATFAKLSTADQDVALNSLEKGDLALDGGIDGKSFFSMFLQNVKEGYFSDPIYGGNRGMAAWQMIGFPGARYDYKEWVAKHGEPFPNSPVGLKGRAAWRNN